MSKIALSGNASGTGTFTFASPGTNTDRTLTLPDATGTVNVSGLANEVPAGSAGAPAIYPTGDTNTGVFFPAADTVAVATDGSERMRINSSGDVGIGTSSPTSIAANITTLDIVGSSGGAVRFERTGATASEGYLAAVNEEFRLASTNDVPLTFRTNNTEQARIDIFGNLMVGTTSTTPYASSTGSGISIRGDGLFGVSRDAAAAAAFNRNTSDGNVIEIRQAGTVEGLISVSGTTVSYGGGHLSRWAQFPDNSRPELLKGTVMSNLDQMSNWDNEDNEQLNCVQVSTVEGDANVAGVFVAWDTTEDDYNDILLGMTGDMVIRIAGGTTVQRGDLLMSAGDGTAKPQGDDIVRSKTIAKVTSTHVSHTYADGSYAVPCVLMAC
jgi:hypothetical protein